MSSFSVDILSVQRSLMHCCVDVLHHAVITCQSKTSSSVVMSLTLDFSVDAIWDEGATFSFVQP